MSRSNGFSLIEMVLSTVIISVLMGAMVSVILISQRAIDDGTSTSARTVSGRSAIDEITEDLKLATTVTESTATEVTFTVPDRTGDDAEDTIRYAWSGVAGDPITRTFNGTTADFVENVHDLDFTFFMRTRLAATPVGKRLLMVVVDAADLPADDLERKTQLEAWGYTVSVIDDNATQKEYDDDALKNDVVYISESTVSSYLNTKLKFATIPVVCEEVLLADEFGFSGSSVHVYAGTSIDVTNNTHYITWPYPMGSLAIYSPSKHVNYLNATLSVGALVLATVGSNKPSLVVLDTGAVLYGGGVATGRRVMLPWCATGYSDYIDLTPDALEITKRALEWALGADAPIAQWKFDEGTGAATSDSVGSHDGTISGATWTTGHTGDALLFDGVDDYVIVPHSDALSLTEGYTFTAWIYIGDGGLNMYDLVLNKGTTGSNWNYWFGTLGDEIAFGFYNGGYIEFNTTGVDLEKNTWYHIAASFDNTNDSVKVYLNGSVVLSQSTTSEPIANSDGLYLGTSQNGAYWNGKFDDVRIYNQVLSDDRIGAIYNE